MVRSEAPVAVMDCAPARPCAARDRPGASKQPPLLRLSTPTNRRVPAYTFRPLGGAPEHQHRHVERRRLFPSLRSQTSQVAEASTTPPYQGSSEALPRTQRLTWLSVSRTVRLTSDWDDRHDSYRIRDSSTSRFGLADVLERLYAL